MFCSEVTKALLLQDPQFTKLADFLVVQQFTNIVLSVVFPQTLPKPPNYCMYALTFQESLPMEEAVNMTLNHLQDQKVIIHLCYLQYLGHIERRIALSIIALQICILLVEVVFVFVTCLFVKFQLFYTVANQAVWYS